MFQTPLVIQKSLKKILVVSDNPELTVFFRNEIQTLNMADRLSVNYCYSTINKNPQSMIDVGASEINVKLPTSIDFLIKNYELIISLHCKQIFPQDLVVNVRCINFHPGYNPYNRGWFPQVFSIINGLPVGVTIHIMDEEIDHGDIIAQETVTIDVTDTSYEVYRKIIAMEKALIQKHLLSIIQGTFQTVSPSAEGNYNDIQDYKALCQLDLTNVASLEEHINYLRAMTHGEFNNAYFFDKHGNKCFIKIIIEREICLA